LNGNRAKNKPYRVLNAYAISLNNNLHSQLNCLANYC